jgi:TPR repeat protein
MKSYLIALLVPLCAVVSANDGKPRAPSECRVRYEAQEYVEAMRVCTRQSSQPEAQYYIGRMHEKGQGVPSDMAIARGWYEKAAKANHAESQYRLSAAYRFGAGGLPKDDAQAVEWLKRSAENGYPRAQKYLAAGYERGLLGLPKDPERARMWRERAEKGGQK